MGLTPVAHNDEDALTQAIKAVNEHKLSGSRGIRPLPSAVAEFVLRTKEALLWHLILNKCRVDTGEPWRKGLFTVSSSSLFLAALT
jgi:hypothetical protein